MDEEEEIEEKKIKKYNIKILCNILYIVICNVQGVKVGSNLSRR